MAIKPINGFYVHDEETNTDGVANISVDAVDGIDIYRINKELGCDETVVFQMTSGSSHSSSKDRMYVHIPAGDEVKTKLNLDPANSSIGFQVWVIYEDGTEERIVNGVCETEYNFKANKNIVSLGATVGAPSANSTATFTVKSDGEIRNAIEDITTTKTYTSTQSNNYLYFKNLSIEQGQKFSVIVNLVSGASSDILLYPNSTSEASFATMPYGIERSFTASEKITQIVGYARAFNSGVLSGTLTVKSDLQYVEEEIDAENARVDDIAGRVGETATSNFYIANGSSHSANNDRVQVQVKAGETVNCITNLNPADPSHGVQYWVYYKDGTNYHESAYAENTVSIVAEKDVSEIGVTVGQVSVATTATLKATYAGTYGERITALENNLPDYAAEIVDTMESTLQDVQNSRSVSVAFLTDIHVNGADYSDNGQRALNVSVNAINNIIKKQPLDFVMLNGDHTYNGTSTSTKTALVSWYKKMAETTNKLKPPVFIGKGNHDVNDIGGTTDAYFSDEELYDLFLKHATLKYTGNYGQLEKAYGFFDVPNKKTRFIFVNTSDVPFIENGGNIQYTQQHTTGVGNEQLNFIAKALEFSETGWGVVFMSHHILQNSDVINPNDISENYLVESHGGDQLIGIINAYKTGGTYSSTTTGDFAVSFDVDYSNNESNEVIAMIAGHTHSDKSDVVNGILMITTMASSYIYTSYDANGNPVSRTPRTATETSWDIYTIDRMNKKIFATRYGAGSDREFSYGT